MLRLGSLLLVGRLAAAVDPLLVAGSGTRRERRRCLKGRRGSMASPKRATKGGVSSSAFRGPYGDGWPSSLSGEWYRAHKRVVHPERGTPLFFGGLVHSI
uniref:(northern house mosquito) hypothetical protein n=1 Tax=Culex pipiens TaxID=7175 RepID=A0A8D8NKR9_CULPI